MTYLASSTLTGVLRDLEDMERHRRCFAYTWRYDAGTFTCSSCSIERRAIDRMFYNQITGVSGESDTVSGGPGSLLTPRGRGRSSSGVSR